jgi:hypothetical protein
MAYQYDAFFSYKRDRESDAWHERVKKKLEFWVKQEPGVGPSVKFFFDCEEISTGMRWHQKLASALKVSKCLICVWSPLYFQSKWCLSEWKTFVAREKIGNWDLVVPASFFDGDTFPSEAKERQFMNFSDFTSTMPRFWDTDSAVQFEEKLLKPFAKDLARMIRAAPPYDETFPIVEESDDNIQTDDTIRRISDA